MSWLVPVTLVRDEASVKYFLAGLAVVAAVAALFFRPPVSQAPAAADGTSPRAGTSTSAAVPSGDTSSVDGFAAKPHRRGRDAGRGQAGSKIVVYIAGEVAKPGVYALPAGSRAEAALARAGGARPDADLVAVNLAERLDDGVEIAVPRIGESIVRHPHEASRRRAGHPARGHGRHRQATKLTPSGGQVDLNTAAAGDLETLPGIGAGLAARIVAYRELNGPFASLDELADVSGITPRIQEEIADFVVVR